MSENRCRIIWICEEYACYLHGSFSALCIFMSTHANSWIKVAARLNTIWIRFGNRRAIRRRVEPGMALTAIGEITQWGGVADWSGSRTTTMLTPISRHYLKMSLAFVWYWTTYVLDIHIFRPMFVANAAEFFFLGAERTRGIGKQRGPLFLRNRNRNRNSLEQEHKYEKNKELEQE